MKIEYKITVRALGITTNVTAALLDSYVGEMIEKGLTPQDVKVEPFIPVVARPVVTTPSLPVKVLAEQLTDAYSTGRYGSWFGCVSMLRRRGYNDAEISAIIRSKWTRWAADNASKDAGVTSGDLARWMDDPRNDVNPASVAGLVDGSL